MMCASEQAGGRMTEMTPDEFLAQARPLTMDEESREGIDILKKHIQDGKTLDPLNFNMDGREDGRHRAHAAKELGIATVPVIDYRAPARSTASEADARPAGGEVPEDMLNTLQDEIQRRGLDISATNDELIAALEAPEGRTLAQVDQFARRCGPTRYRF